MPSAARSEAASAGGSSSEFDVPTSARDVASEDVANSGGTGAGAAPNVGQTGGSTTSPGSTPTGSAAPAPGASGGPIPVGEGVRGVTDSTIRIGVISFDSEGTSEMLSTVTGGQFPLPDFEKVTRAVVDHLNANGGIAGRQVEPVFHRINTAAYTQQSGRQREMQQACAHWTEDEPVFAMSGHGLYEEVALECAASTGTVMVATSAYLAPSQERYEQMADVWYAPHHLVAERRERTMAQGLLTQGFFGPDASVAVMMENRPDIRAGVENGLLPTLAAAGIEPELMIAYPDPIQSPWNSYILQMQAAGVTHVVFSTTTAGPLSAVFTMRAAEDQRFRPFWAIGSENSPSGIAQLAPRPQVANTRGAGWQPANDILQTEPVSANDQLCRDLMRGIGEPEDSGAFICEVLFFLRDALARASEVSPAGLSAAMDALASDYPSQLTIDGATRFSRTRRDGPSQFRSFTFDERCGQEGAPCFRYVGDTLPLPD